MGTSSVLDDLYDISQQVREQFRAQRRVLSFQDYLEVFAADARRHSRDAVQYIRDAFDYFGKEEVSKPWGEATRFRLFDLPWLESRDDGGGLIGQEAVQNELYRILNNFAREGRPNRLPLLHGPNGSAKSTVARCIMQALEHYSTTDEGALYRFHWVFPSKRSTRGAIGFGDKLLAAKETASYGQLPEEQIDARLIDELRDHPLLLLPRDDRRALLRKLLPNSPPSRGVNQWLWHGSLSHKNRAVFDALLASCEGDLAEVLRHVQVERYFVSKRYRTAAVTIGPELSIDAGERQITADRSLGALPSSLQAVTLFETHGELIEASGGLIEFSDLLKRPLERFKYLQITAETGEVALPTQNIRINCVMLASSNETELAAFRKHPEFESFRSRLELIRMPYLLSWRDEQAIYDTQIAPHLQVHVVPHATRVAAMFAVLTRLNRPNPDGYQREIRDIVRSLTAFEKLELYADGKAPARLDADKRKAITAAVEQLYREFDSHTIYEGCIGASPREMRTVLLDAAQNPDFHGLSPFGVLEELDALCAREVEYVWLQLEAMDGGFHDHAEFRRLVRDELLEWTEDEFRRASGLIDEQRYAELFTRYIHHVSHWAKSEKVRNAITGADEDPDERLMEEVETLLDLPDQPQDLRHSWMNLIAAWAIDHPGEALDIDGIFSVPIRRLRDAVFRDRRTALVRLSRNVMVLLRQEGAGLDATERQDAQRMVDRLCADFGYEPASVADTCAMLLKLRLDAQN